MNRDGGAMRLGGTRYLPLSGIASSASVISKQRKHTSQLDAESTRLPF